jgi:AcrR family transcriptional regulator
MASDTTTTEERTGTDQAGGEEAGAARLPRLDGPLLERSRQIIGAAYDLLAEEGLEGLTIRAVLKKTGLSRRAFYERFSGKDDLVLAVFEQTIRLAADFFGAQVQGMADPMERLKLIVSSIVLGAASQNGADDPSDRRGAALSREHLRLADTRPEELQAALKPLISLIAEQLSAAMTVRQVRTYAPQRLALLVYNVVSTTVHTELITQEGARPDRARRVQLADEIWEFCRRAIAA